MEMEIVDKLTVSVSVGSESLVSFSNDYS